MAINVSHQSPMRFLRVSAANKIAACRYGRIAGFDYWEKTEKVTRALVANHLGVQVIIEIAWRS